MTVSDFHKSISTELQAIKNRVRSMAPHWGEDGAYKEVVLRRLLKGKLPAQFTINSGFVCTRKSSSDNAADREFDQEDVVANSPVDADVRSSTQTDIIIQSISAPNFFSEGDFVITMPEFVQAMVEVKTDIDSPGELKEYAEKLGRTAKFVRRHRDAYPPRHVFAGVFSYAPRDVDMKNYLESLKTAARGEVDRAIDAVVLGPNRLLLFWDNQMRSLAGASPAERAPHWRAYELNDYAVSYFIGNLIESLSGVLPVSARELWYPVLDGKNALEIAGPVYLR